MTSAPLNASPGDRELVEWLRHCDALDLVESAVAIVDVGGHLLYQNTAFERFNKSVRDTVKNFEAQPTLLDCPSIQRFIHTTLASNNENLLKQEFFYSQKIKVVLTLKARPIKKNNSGKVIGAAITVGEESIAFDNRYLARSQESLQTLVERVRALSAEMINKDRLIRVLLKEAPFATMLMNEHRQILQVNRAGEKLFGASERELVGQSCDSVLHCFQKCQRCPILQDKPKIEQEEILGFSAEKQPVSLLRSAVMFDDGNQKIIIESFIDLSERRQAEDKITRLGRILDDSTNEIYVFDAASLNFVQVNQGGLQNLGYSLENLKALTPLDLIPEYTQKSFEELLAPLRRGEKLSLTFETHFQRKHGSLYPVEVRLQLSLDETPPVFFAIVQDISQRRRSEAQMHQLSLAVEQTADIVVITDRNGTIQYVNAAYEETTGYSRDEVVGKNANVVKSGEHSDSFYQELWQTILAGEVFQGILTNRKKDGSLYFEEKTISPLKDAGGHIVSFVSTGKDITERLQSEKHLHHIAHHDALTDLPNRVMLQKHLIHAMQEADRIERMVAVLFIDLDHFKHINDTLGHDFGDALLKSVAERLTHILRPGDTVSRLGGDEFTIILANVAHVDDVTNVSQKILDQFIPPFRIGGRELFITPSIGITLYPLDDKDEAHLLRDADIAMYRAKEMGRNQYQFYTPELNIRAARRLELETGLRQAVEKQELVLHYQPLVDMRTGRIRGTEALLRWQHPKFGMIPPLDFIPLAEDTGLIVPIGEWVLKTACAQIRAWQDTGFPALQVAVNLSSKQLRDKNLVKVIERVLAETGIAASALDLELTESVLMQDMELAAGILKDLKAVGVSFSLDDFGTGYSSLGYLKRFPIDYLKIDRSFIRDITTDSVGAGLVQAIIAMAKVLNIKVIAEGVETYEQLDFLRSHECDISQGYYCSPPVKAETFTDLLRDWKLVKAGKCNLKD